MRFFAFLLGILVLLSCSPRGSDRTWKEPEENPLYVEVLADEEIDFLVGMTVEGISQPDVRRAHERALAEAQRLQQWTNEKQDEGERGHFVSDHYFVDGRVLLLSDSLYLGFSFVVEAAPGLHLALSKVLIPKTYDDFTAGEYRDLGPLKSIVGPQSYTLQPLVEKNSYASVVLYSPELKVVIGFAQI